MLEFAARSRRFYWLYLYTQHLLQQAGQEKRNNVEFHSERHQIDPVVSHCHSDSCHRIVVAYFVAFLAVDQDVKAPVSSKKRLAFPQRSWCPQGYGFAGITTIYQTDRAAAYIIQTLLSHDNARYPLGCLFAAAENTTQIKQSPCRLYHYDPFFIMAI